MKGTSTVDVLDERKDFIQCGSGSGKKGFQCEKDSIAGAVSQRACVYCGARVVLNPITDAFHIVHGPIGCASYTWDIRGSLSSGSEIYRNSFSTDLREKDVVFGGEKKLERAIDEIVAKYSPKVIFVYATCIVGVIGDDIQAVCKRVEEKYHIRAIPIQSSGFAGNKSVGYKLACEALLQLMATGSGEKLDGINYLGDFNLAAEAWIIKDYLKKLGINIISTITGDAKCEDLQRAPGAKLNIVQCAGSMIWLAKKMQEKYGMPYIQVSFYGLEDIKLSFLRIADALGDQAMAERAKALILEEEARIKEKLEYYKKRLSGKKAAIYVGGGFKAISLIKQFKDLGMETVMVGTQTGRAEEYEVIRKMANAGTVILDDANPSELEKFMKEKGADILVGGVKERFLAYKLGVAFCDHNHERKHPLCGFEGAVNFAQEVDLSINSPVWGIVKECGAKECGCDEK